jgi:hypothetical protein
MFAGSMRLGMTAISTKERKSMRKFCQVAAAMALLVPDALFAGANAPSNANAVFVGGTPIIRVRVASGGYSPDQRAEHIQNRVNKLLGEGPIYPSDITVQPVGNEAEVLVKGQLLFTADWATARFNQSTPMELANMWADRVRAILPKLTEPK